MPCYATLCYALLLHVLSLVLLSVLVLIITPHSLPFHALVSIVAAPGWLHCEQVVRAIPRSGSWTTPSLSRAVSAGRAITQQQQQQQQQPRAAAAAVGGGR